MVIKAAMVMAVVLAVRPLPFHGVPVVGCGMRWDHLGIERWHSRNNQLSGGPIVVRSDHLTIISRCSPIVRSGHNSSLGIWNLLLPVNRLRWLHVAVIATIHGYRRILGASRRIVDHDGFVARAAIVNTTIYQGLVVFIWKWTRRLGEAQLSLDLQDVDVAIMD